jgi:aspartate aminotransferase-like enzyme
MVEELPKALDNLKKIVFCEKGEAFIIAGAGTLAMEMALLNTLASGEKALIISQGYFGSRMAEICGSFGLDYDILESTWGRAVLPEELSKRLADGDYRIVVATHVDTATGACAPVRDYAEVLKRRDLLFIVDGVCATGGIEERMDDWGIDVVFTAEMLRRAAGAGRPRAFGTGDGKTNKDGADPGLLFRPPALAPDHERPRQILFHSLRQRDPGLL